MQVSAVPFDTAQYSLRPRARERLTRVVDIFLGHSDLTLASKAIRMAWGGGGRLQSDPVGWEMGEAPSAGISRPKARGV
jgi:hypothetical protein